MSTEFTDSLGRKWSATLDFAAAKRVRGAVKVTDEKGNEVPFDLIDAGNIGLVLQVLQSKYYVVGESLYQICKPEADQKGVTEEQFLAACYGDALDQAKKVIEEELILFFPKSLREIIRLIVQKSNEMREEAIAEAGTNLEEVTLEALNQSGQSPTKQPA